MENLAVWGSIAGLGLASGVNLYATVLVIGLGTRLGLLQLNPALAHLQILSDPVVLAVAGVAYLAEFLADKIPWVDSAWDSLHTFIRPVGAALLGATAIGAVDPAAKTVAALLCGGVALSGHSTKAGIRLLANHSPEPLTNVGLSLGEDILAVGGTFAALQYPIATLLVLGLFLILFLAFAPRLLRLLRAEVSGIRFLLKKLLSSPAALPSPLVETLPENYRTFAEKRGLLHNLRCCLPCVIGAGVNGIRHAAAFFCLSEERAFLLTRRWFRVREVPLDLTRSEAQHFESRLFFDELRWHSNGKRRTLFFYKESANRGEKILQLLSRPAVRAAN